MNQILLVAKREFLSQAKNKTFIIMTFLSPLIMVGIFGIIFWMMSANSNQKNVAVVDQSGEFITSLASGDNEIYNFYPDKDISGIKDTLLTSKLDALLVIPKFEENNFEQLEKGIELYTNGNIGVAFKEKLERKLNSRLEDMKMEYVGISKEDLTKTKANISIKSLNLKEGMDIKSKESDYIKFGVAMALAYIIFMFIMLYGVKVMRSVVEEKNNRVVEIIISSVKPFNLMMGKIVGTTFVALLQFTIWILMGGLLMLGISAFLSSKINISDSLNSVQAQEALAQQNPEWINETQGVLNALMSLNYPFIIILFLVFFLLGYLFYSSIFAAIGSAVDNETDTQQFTFYPIFPMIIAMYGSMTTLENPDGPVAFWLSIIPLTSPISMVTRLPFGVEWWEIALSLTLLTGFMLFMVYFAAKIYRVGILMYGKKPSIKEIWKWIRYSS